MPHESTRGVHGVTGRIVIGTVSTLPSPDGAHFCACTIRFDGDNEPAVEVTLYGAENLGALMAEACREFLSAHEEGD